MIDSNYQRTMARLLNAYNGGDFDAFLRELADNVRFRSPLAGETAGGHSGVRHLLSTARDRLRLRRLETGPAFQNQAQIAMDVVGTAEAPGGGTLSLNIILVVEFAENGLIQEVRFFWDPKPLLPHLGG